MEFQNVEEAQDKYLIEKKRSRSLNKEKFALKIYIC